jgi:hypothetical protein
MFVSVTRLRIRSLPAWLQFVRSNEGAVRQVMGSPGFIRGKLLVDGFRTFWTMTLWQDENSMRAYRGSGAHGAVMGNLPRWCDEASVAHWTQSHDELPDWQEPIGEYVPKAVRPVSTIRRLTIRIAAFARHESSCSARSHPKDNKVIRHIATACYDT